MPEDRRTFVRFAGALAGIGAAAPLTAAATTDEDDDDESNDCPDGLVTVEGRGDTVEATVECIAEAIREKGLTVMTTVDHAANADSVDMDLPPTTLLLFGNPAIGTQLMQRSRTVGLDLPQRMLVWEDDEGIKVTYTDPEFLAERHDIDTSGRAPLLSKVKRALREIATADCDDGDD